jgi:putative tryptophan/tyrosine transport system substrate-binding protein
MKRRKFITLLGSAAMWPLAVRAQQSAMPVIGFIGGSTDSNRDILAFLKGLGESGYVDGRNVVIEYRWVEGHNERLPAILADLIQRRVDVIAAVNSTAAALAAKAATSTIPIVFRIGDDPVAIGLVAGLNRPGGNLTGSTTLGSQLGPKRLEVLRELIPTAAAVAVLVNPTNTNAARQIEELQTAARLLSVRLVIFNVSRPNDFEAAFAQFGEHAIGGVLTAAEPLFFQQRDHLVALVARQAIPAIYSDPFFPEGGGLMSYGASVSDGYRTTGAYVARVLKGEKPGDLPVQQSTKVELAINLKTAKALGITVPQLLLGRADEVIE